MESRVERAAANHDLHYNCCQSVACAYTDLVGADHMTVYRLTEGYGAGCGGKKGTCGALLGACAIAGLVNSDCNLEQPQSKHSTNDITARLFDRFEEEVGATVCGVIKGVATGEPLMGCHEVVMTAARILEEELLAAGGRYGSERPSCSVLG